MEGKGMTAEESPSPGDNGEQNEKIGAKAHGGEIVPTRGAVSPAAGNEPGMSANWQRPRVRVDARLLEATLLNLRKRIAAIPLVFDIPGADEVTAERGKLLSQIDDYLLPRVRQSAAPLLVALVGSTGAGKSTLVNSIVGTQVSQTGVRRPTTNSPVLACHPDDIHWFAENMFLPTLPRVRQEGLARPGRDGLLVLAASEGMTKGIALLDTPDIDSVVRAHYDFAYQFLDASDLWLFMTSASRYADAPVWELLQHARERGAALGVVLSRVPPSHRTELVAHFNAMLDANGIQAENRFVIPETGLVDGYLPDDIFQPIRDWLDDTAKRADRRVAVLSQTMSGMLDTFKTRVPRLAAHVDAQVVLRTRLRREAESRLRDRAGGVRRGHPRRPPARGRGACPLAGLRGQRRPRQPRCAASGPSPRCGAAAGGPGPTPAPPGYAALDAALRAALQSLVVSVADRAAEQVARVWRDNPGGAALIAAAEASRVRDERAKREFESAFGTDPADQPPAKQGAFDRSSPDLPLRVSRAVSAWQDQPRCGCRPGEQPSGIGAGPITRATGRTEARPMATYVVRGEPEAGPVSVMTLVALLGEPSQAWRPRPAGAGGGRRERDRHRCRGSCWPRSSDPPSRPRCWPGPGGSQPAGRAAARRGAAAVRRGHRRGRPGRFGRRRPALPGRVLAGGGAMTSSPARSAGRAGRADPVPAPRRAGRAGQDRPGPSGQGESRRRRQGRTTRPAAGFGQALLDDADAVLKRAGERLRLSSSHTVVALAGGTGSGKSTLFNALSGATFSPPGVTRPTTRHVHACVWGMQGAAPLLDWLNVQRRHRYARASVLDSGESDLDGLLLLDLPDHDSVVTASMAAVDRLSKLADMVIWVLDPQKYADAAVHNRYLIPLAGHASVFTVVLNQIDPLPPEQIRDCEQDLRRLLDAEGLTDTPVLPVSARTGAGLGELRALLMETVQRNRAVTDRIAADIDAVIGGFEAYAGPQIAPDAALAGARPWPGRRRDARRPAGAPAGDDDEPPDPSRPPWELDDEQHALAQPAPSRPPWEDATPDGAKRDAVDPSASVPAAPAAAADRGVRARRPGVAAVAQADGERPRGAGGPADRLAGRAAAAPPRRGCPRCAAGADRGRPGRRGGRPGAAVRGGQRDHRVRRLRRRRAPGAVGGQPARGGPQQRRPGAAGAGRRGARRGRRGRSRAAGLVAARHALAVAADRGGGRRRGRWRW